MHLFDIQPVNQNHGCVLSISGDLLYLLRNIPTIVRIMCMRHGCEGVMHAQFIMIGLCIGNKYCFGGVRSFKTN